MPTCPDCHGTGRDDKKTATLARNDADFRHRAKHHGTYVRCWTCVGNGIVPTEGRVEVREGHWSQHPDYDGER